MVQLRLFSQLPSLGHAKSESGVDVGVGVAVMITEVGMICMSAMDVGVDSGHTLTPLDRSSLSLPSVSHAFPIVLAFPLGRICFE